MRRGREAGGEKMGGAWHCAVRFREEESEPAHSPEAGATANTTGEADNPCPDESCTKGPCTVGMSLQQS
jgi:hypothetical protein